MIALAFHQARVRSSATGSPSVALEGSRAAKLPPSGAPGWAPRRCPRRGARLQTNEPDRHVKRDAHEEA
jgi:hypothetical protein